MNMLGHQHIGLNTWSSSLVRGRRRRHVLKGASSLWKQFVLSSTSCSA